jgi:excisionase family DNA binding protein
MFKNLTNEHEVASLLGVSVATVRRWRLLKTGPRFIKIGRLVRYKPEDLEDWLQSRPSAGGKTEVDDASATT